MDQMPLGMEVSLGPGNTMLDGDIALQSPHGKGHRSLPHFLRPYKPRPMSVVAKWPDGSDHLVRRLEVCLGPGDKFCGDPASPSHGKGLSSPHFSAHFALAGSTISATAELLLHG